MYPPVLKKVPEYVPDIIRTGVVLALTTMYEGKVFDDKKSCPRCGSSKIVKLGRKEKVFATVITDEGFKEIKVKLQKYRCNDCHYYFVSDGPFYEGTMYGKPIVDMALMLGMSMPANAAEKVLMNFGIQLDKCSILNYIREFADRSRELAPLMKGQGGGLYAVNLLKVMFGVKSADELSKKLEASGLSSIADETYPRVKGAVSKFMDELKKEGTKVELGPDGKATARDAKGHRKFPDSFTLATSYVPEAQSFSSFILTKSSFNELLAQVLFTALKGTVVNVTDGSRSYEGVENHVHDPVHETRNELKRDKNFRKMKEEAKEIRDRIRKEEHNGENADGGLVQTLERRLKDISDYAKNAYREKLRSVAEGLRNLHPELFNEDGSPKVRLTTNGIEGGNWRIKYSIRVPYVRNDSMAGKGLLACIMDSAFTFRRGRPTESPGNSVGHFTFSRVMR